MRKFVVFAALMFLLSSTSVLGASLQVEKLIDKSEVNVGDSVRVLLKFTNPFNREIPVRIVDKNIFGNNGLDVQCLEYTLPNKREVVLEYEPIVPYSPGTYTLGEAQVTYTNPDTGREETVRSNSLTVEVKGSGPAQAQGITTIYKCGGVSMRSTSFSSGSSFSVQIGSSQTFGRGNPGSVQSNQMNQDMSALKQEMERQIQEQKKMRKEFQKNLMGNQRFQELNENLTEMGYNITEVISNPQTSNTGSFEAFYRKPNGETAVVKGEMKNGTVTTLVSLTAEEKKLILEKLFKNPKFQEYDKKLRARGFNMTQPIFQLYKNKTEVSIPYKSETEENKITADFVNNTVKNVRLEKELREQNPWVWLILLVVIVFAILVAYKKLKKVRRGLKKEPEEIPENKRQIDWKKETKKMIEEAKKLYSRGMEKDAYEKVSRAVRFYFSWKMGLRKELTAGELENEMRRRKMKELDEVRKCLSLCELVEFAKYKPSKKDFDKIIKMTEKITN